MQRRRRALLSFVSVALPASAGMPALGAGSHDDAHGHGGSRDDGGRHGHGDLAFGSPASTAEADRTVRIRAYDSMAFDPSPITVEAGETVRFVVTNAGDERHSFTLDAPAYQRRHERAIQGMAARELAGHMDDVPNGVVVPPGETGALTWTFARGGPVQFACHLPGALRRRARAGRGTAGLRPRGLLFQNFSDA